MKKMMSIAAVALMMAGSMAFACDSCGCADKKADKAACCTAEKKCDGCSDKKACAPCEKKAEAAKKAEASE